MIYEVQKNGVSLEWTNILKDAEDAFKDASPGDVVFYQITEAGKKVYRRK